MDPSSPESQAILRYYNVTYDEVVFYEFHHQIGKYVSDLVPADEPKGESLLVHIFHIKLLLAGITIMLWDHITTM